MPTKSLSLVMDLTHLSWPFFDVTHQQLAASFAGWAAAHLGQFERDEGGDGRAARCIFELLSQSDWLRHTLPGRADNSGRVDLRAVCLLRELSGYSSAVADVALSEPWLGILPIALAGSPELRAAYLPRYASGELLPAFALSEPGAGSDAAAITTTARFEDGGYVLDGRKTWTSNCGLADLYVVFAQMEDGSGISAFAVDGGTEGMTFDERLEVLPPHTVGTWTLEGCRVPADHLIGTPGQGFKVALSALELFRPTVGAATLGFARRAMAEAIDRSKRRTTFGKPIAEHQLVQGKLADMAVRTDAAALLVYRAAWQHDTRDGSIARAAAIAKLYATEAGFETIDQALQLFGGLGVVNGTPVERLFRHSRAFRIFDGSSEIQQLIIAKELLTDPRASMPA